MAAHKIGFLLLPDFSHLGLALAVEPLFIANWLTQDKIFEWSLISPDGKPVRASNGMKTAADSSLATAEFPGTLFVVASFTPKEHAKNRDVTRWLRRLARFGVEMGGIETGSELLAAAGLLDGHEAAAHWDNLKGFQERYPDVAASTLLYTMGRNRLTCAGATSILDMMLAWMAERIAPDLAADVARHMLVTQVRDATGWQGVAPDDGNRRTVPSAIEKALAVMQQSIEEPQSGEPLSCEEIAGETGLSLRQLQRQFRQHFNRTIIQHYTRIRLAKAHQLLQQTDLTVTEVALGSGFGSVENFSRLYRRQFGCPPSMDRRQSTTAPVFRS